VADRLAPPSLTSKQRQYLKGLAHPLSPVVRVGRAGLTDAVTAEARTALRAHELIKVRVEAEDAADRRALAEELAAGAAAHLVGTVGKIAILYRARDEEPEIRLPR
jgi:RNA-binding protein